MPDLLRPFQGHRKKNSFVGVNSDTNVQNGALGPSQAKLQVLDTSAPKSSLWGKALATVKQEGWQPPAEWDLDNLDLKDAVETVRREAQDRADDAVHSERHIAGTKYTYREVYDKVAKYAKDFQAVGDLIVQADPGYSALPWAIFRFVITASVGESETYHRMLEGTKDVSQLTTQYSVIEATYARVDSKLAQELRNLLENFYTDLLRYQIFAIKYFDPDGKFLRAVRGLNPIGAREIQEKRSAINATRDKVDRAIALVHYDVSKYSLDEIREGKDILLSRQQEQDDALREGIIALAHNTGASFQSQNAILQQQFSKINDLWSVEFNRLNGERKAREEERQIRQLNRIRKWISPAEPESNRFDARNKRHMDLGDWLIQHSKFQDWQKSNESTLLWLYGFAGTGKTGLVCRVIDHLQAQSQTENPARLGFFFCSNDKAGDRREDAFSRSNPIDALRSIVGQLAISMKDRMAAPTVLAKYDIFGFDRDQGRPLTQAECRDILVTISQDLPIVIVLDAFDELDQVKSLELLAVFADVVEHSPYNIKIFISTRPFPAIEENIASHPFLEVTAENNGPDVRTFVEETLQKHIKNGDLLEGKVSEDLQSNIEDILTTRAQNMFLYASLLLTQICNPNHTDDEQSVRKKLEDLPKNITDMYHGLLAEIHDEKNNSIRSCRLAQNTFKWLLCAQEPLRFTTLLEAIAPAESAASLEEVLHTCKTLVVKGKSTVEFAHYTVREHIIKMAEYSSSKCHLAATEGCLRALNSSVGVNDGHSSDHGQSRPFVEYAVLHWPIHFEGITVEDMERNRTIINPMLRNFLLKGRSKVDKYAQWFTLAQREATKSRNHQHLSTRLKHLEADPPSALFAACVFGHEEVIGKFGRDLDGLNRHNSHGQTALCLAIENRKIEVVRTLLTRRFPAELNMLNVKAATQFESLDLKKPLPDIILYASAMQCAAAVGDTRIAKYLMDQGANIDLVAGYYGSPLQAAAHNGHTEMVSLLLSNGAELNSQGGYYGNALQAAAAKGHHEIVTMLLESKPPAVISTPGGRHGSALRAAVYSGSSDTVWALLDERADPNFQSKDHTSLLEAAASMGQSRSDIVSLLLEHGAETDITPRPKSLHILHLAALHNMVDLACYCLDKKCQIDMMTIDGPKYHRRYSDFPTEMTPLGFACAEGHVEMVEFLLLRGASYEVDKPRSALLWSAAYQGHASVVEILIARFKERHSSEELHKFFEQRPSPRSGHPLMFAAASSGNARVVQVLIEQGVEYKSNWYGATPLLATATFGCPSVTSMLLDYHEKGIIDVCFDKQADNGRTVLLEAFANNRWRIVKMLLQYPVDMMDLTLTDKGGATALHLSTNHENEDSPALLIDAALSKLEPRRFLDFINFRHSSGRTALLDCADRNRSGTLRRLLDHGADFTIPGHAGNSPLHFACRHGYEHIIQPLFQRADMKFQGDSNRHKAFVNHQNKDGVTPIMETVYYSRATAFELLLDEGADYSIARFNKETLLHVAAYHGNLDIVSTFLRKGSQDADQGRFWRALNASNDAGRTPLIDAAEQSHPEILDLLLRYGADWSICSNARFNALHFCVFRNHTRCAEILLQTASENNDSSKFCQFLNQQGANGATPIRDAAINGHTHLVRLLLRHDPDLELVDNGQRHILQHAVGQENEEMFTVIMDHLRRKGDAELVRRLVYVKEDRGDNVVNGVKRRALPRMKKLLEEAGIDLSK